MPRPKKPQYEYIPSRGFYRKRIKDVDGKYVAIYGKTPDELTEKLEIAKRQIENSVFRRENPTVKDYAEKWLEMHASHIRPTTLIDYTSCVKNYIIAVIGDKYIADVTPDDVKLAIVKASLKSASVYHKTEMLYKKIFSSAVESNVISKSPCENLNPKGGKKAKEKQALTNEQTKILLDAVRELPVYPFVMLCLCAGLRREEALALKWDSVHLKGDAPYITVSRTWYIDHNRPVISNELKTPAAKRDIPIPPQLLDCLKKCKQNSNSEYVISNSEGQPLAGSQWQRLWKYVTTRTTKERHYYRYADGKKTKHTVTPVLGQRAVHNSNVIYSIDFQVTPHQLRHTYITNLLLAGVDVKTVQYLAGHEHAKITLDIYTHLTYNKPADLKDKVNQAFSGYI